MTESSFVKALSNLATKVAEKAAMDETHIQDSTDALKALTPYLALLLKHKSADKTENDQATFLDFQESFKTLESKQEARNGATEAVPGRSRRRN